MIEDPLNVRRQVIRRVRYGLNTYALQNESLPPEGPIDVAITNGLLAIVAHDDPLRVYDADGRTYPATKLIEISVAFSLVEELHAGELREALRVTQPIRHGRADDEWIAPSVGHI